MKLICDSLIALKRGSLTCYTPMYRIDALKCIPNTEKMSSKSKSIANVRENQLNGVDKRNDQDNNEKRHDIPVQKKKSDDQTRAKQLTKEDAEQIISSLAAIF